MANAIYHFTWGTFCDWYVELVKGAFDEETKRVAAWAFDQILVMLHPFMPFVTEELWNANERPYELIVAKWPEPEAQADPRAKAEIEWLIELVSEIRSARTELNVPPSAKLHLFATNASGRDRRSPRPPARDADAAGAAGIDPAFAVRRRGRGASRRWRDDLALPLEGVIDLDAERGRLSKAVAAAEKERDSLAATARQSELHRARQAGGGGKGPLRPRGEVR